jgi:hypothetical protein
MRRYAKLIGGGVLALGAVSAALSRSESQQAQAAARASAKPIVQTETDGAVSKRFFRYGSALIPHVSKQAKGGEDAYVASHNLLVVADGVGGWIS